MPVDHILGIVECGIPIIVAVRVPIAYPLAQRGLEVLDRLVDGSAGSLSVRALQPGTKATTIGASSGSTKSHSDGVYASSTFTALAASL